MKRLISTVLLLISSALIGCSSSNEADFALPEPVSIEISSNQPVEYGASLDEWDEAVNESVSVDSIVDEQPVDAEPTTLLSLPPTELPLLADGQTTSPELNMSAVDGKYMEIEWEDLIPDDFSSDTIMDKYMGQLEALEDGSPEANELYAQMQEELNNSPVNEVVDETFIKIPGFIAPLEYNDTLITEFLLVPYFGACIHMPPPPINQTVLVKMAEGEGLTTEESYWPVWIKGKITTESASTDLAESGYYIQDAVMEIYE